MNNTTNIYSCTFCAQRSKADPTKLKYESTDISKGQRVIIAEMVKIFCIDIFQLFLDDNWSICDKCLTQLKSCFEFVQQIKESVILLRKTIEAEEKFQHSTTTIIPNEITGKKLKTNKRERANARPILPKISNATEATPKICKAENNTPRVYRCLECEQTFSSYKHLKAHEKDCCNETKISGVAICKFCHLCFKYDKTLANHQSLLHNKLQFSCCICKGKFFASKGYLTRHIHDVHSHTHLHYFCGECEEITSMSTAERIKSHFDEFHSSKADSAIQHEDHETLNEDDMDLEMHEEFLDEFLLAHTNENSFQFSECWEALDLHLPEMLHDNPTDKQNNGKHTDAFFCPKCFERFHKMPILLRHLIETHKLSLLLCQSCKKTFSTIRDYQLHKRTKCIENTEAAFIHCPYCTKEFNSTFNLKQHIRSIHTQFKKHICQLCDKQFATLDHLKKHVLSLHQNERKHECHLCSKRFTQLCHLKQHLAIHTTGKSIQCTQCSEKFWRNIDLRRHQQKRHNFREEISALKKGTELESS
ncbi:zinc finger protein 658B-like [Musca domestica]|uniref:Zinc finger protein 658B-like n=1 Tax=Musca domestica TaxID=7370 RepID=A0A1I8M933_MUSDO|nr:zinc finger protein 658B-like [Musca domestica]